MVTLNFTLVVELLLFLLFLWGANAWIIRPALKTMDERESYIQELESAASAHEQEAQTREAEYDRELTQIRRLAEETYRTARQKALDGQRKQVEAKHREVNTALYEVRQAGKDAVAQERASYEKLVPELSDSLAKTLGIGNGNV